MRIEDLNDEDLLRSARRFEESKSEITAAFDKAQKGRVAQVEPPERIARYWAREREHWKSGTESGVRAALSEDLGQERALGMNNDLLSIEFLEEGLIAACSVGMVTVAEIDNGTGFLVGNGLMLTNHHVIRDAESAAGSVLDLDFETNQFGAPKQMERFACDPERFFLTNKSLDFTLVAVKERSSNGRSIQNFGYHPLIAGEGKILIGRPVNIIQHPRGRTKSIVVHDSRFMFVKNGGELDPYCWYTSDTEPGSSGSPVFNNRWEVVALHHRAVPKTNKRGQYLDINGKAMSRERALANPQDLAWEANEGIRTSRLVKAIEAEALEIPFNEVRRELLALWAKPLEIGERARLESHRAENPHLASFPSVGAQPPQSAGAGADSRTGVGGIGQPPIHVAATPTGTMPITITIRVG